MTRTAGAQIGCQRPSRFWGLGCPKIFHEAEDTLVQSFPQVVRIGFGDPAPFAVLSERDRRELLCTAGEDIAVA
ncbi:hypothetical protein, partial [Thiolapillus sp.]|uniref:hypothetical protein n=1 Tax=Thiolapillus sp. TaxID=2017437 RepID=UPI003AF413A1